MSISSVLRPLKALAELTVKFSLVDGPPKEVARLLLVDTIFCMQCAKNSPEVVLASELALEFFGGDACRSFVTGRSLGLLGAILENGTAIRVLDLNDFYWGPGIGGHPSDLFAVSISVGQLQGSSLKDVLQATVLGYEIYLRMLDQLSIESVIDHTTAMKLASTAVVMNLMHANLMVTENAFALALASGPSLSVLRSGSISRSKAMFPSLCAIDGVMMSMLALKGVTGPMESILGSLGMGFMIGSDHQIEEFVSKINFGQKILSTNIKIYPCIGTAQSAVSSMIELHDYVKVQRDNISEIVIRLSDSELIRHQSSAIYKFPKTNETADHSFFSVIAMAAIDGYLNIEQFEMKRFLDANVLAIQDQFKFEYSLDGANQGIFKCQIEVRLNNGETKSSAVHVFDKLKDADNLKNNLRLKFLNLKSSTLLSTQIEKTMSVFSKSSDQQVINALMDEAINAFI